MGGELQAYKLGMGICLMKTVSGKEIQEMFSAGAGRYDLVNRVISFRQDIYWRRIAVDRARIELNGLVLDLATGTGDVAIEVARRTPDSVKIVGVDFCNDMIDLAIKKTRILKLKDRISFQEGRAEELPFSDNAFDRVIVAFGVRNFMDIYQGMKEIYRVLKNEGAVVILEFTLPRGDFISRLAWFYIKHVLPCIGGLISDWRNGYRYLSDSIGRFFKPEELKSIMTDIGFEDVAYERLTFGVATIHTGFKKGPEKVGNGR